MIIRIFMAVILVFALFFSISLQPVIYNETRVLPAPEKKMYDLIVYGADPEGIAAATVAGEQGLSVLLIEERSQLGGLMTLGGLNFIDMNYDSKGTLLTQGIFERFYDAVGGNAFEIDKAIEVFTTFLLDAGVDVLFDSHLVDLHINNKKIDKLLVQTPEGLQEFQAYYVIDTSTDGVLAKMAGVPYTLFGEDIGKPDRLMGVTLVFSLDQVNWGKMFAHLNYNRILGSRANDERQFYGARWRTAWGYSIEGYQYQPQDEQMRLRGLNVARQNNGTVLVNALIIFDVNPLDPESKKKAFERAEAELEYIVPYLNQHFSGFENARLAGTAEDLYVRESRHFITHYVLSIDDVLENRSFSDQIAVGSYPVDIQPAQPGDWGTIVGNPDKYGIPYRSLLPENIDNLLLAGKHAGYSSLAAGSARVIPIGMVTAEAAGLASVLALQEGSTFGDILYQQELFEELQAMIRDNGGFIEPFTVPNPLENIRGYERMKDLRRLGLVSGGYHNEYHFDQTIDKWKYDQMMRGLLEYHQLEDRFIEIDLYPNYGSIPRIFYQMMYDREIATEDAWLYARQWNLFEDLYDWVEKSPGYQPTVSEVYIFLSNVHHYLEKRY